MGKFFKDIKEGLEEYLACKEGKITLLSETIEIPEPPKKYKAKDIQRIRNSLRCSQAIFALYLNISIKTVQAWESGQRSPSQAALRLLELIDAGIYLPKAVRTTDKKQKTQRRVAAQSR